jgi:predicted metal-dependent phosphoesterase TrpH
MLADLHIHSKYSSHALYINDTAKKEKISTLYPEHELFSEQPNFLSKVLVDGTSHVKDIMVLEKKRGLSAIAITDHNTTIGNLEAQKMAESFGLIVVPAMELSTDSGEILAYGITSKIDKSLPVLEAIEQIHAQGGVAIAAHPFNMKHPNIDFARLDEEMIKKLPLDGLEAFDPLRGRVDAHFLDLAKQLNIAITGGSDAHLRYQIGKGLTIFPDSCKSWHDMVEAIKQRETYVTGFRISKLRIAADMLWCTTFGRYMINKRWGSEKI